MLVALVAAPVIVLVVILLSWDCSACVWMILASRFQLYLVPLLIHIILALQDFVRELSDLKQLDRIDHVVLNAGVLSYPNVR